MNQVQLLNDLVASYSETELRDVSFRLHVNYEDLDETTRRGKARELIGYLERRQRLPELARALAEDRPHLAAKYAAYLAQASVAPAPQPVAPAAQPVAAEAVANPYNAGPMVTDPTMFFGREDERRRLRANLLNMGSSSVVGMRRIGKSSLVHYLTNDEPLPATHQFLIAYLDLQDGRYHTLNGLLNGAVQAWADQSGRTAPPAVNGLADFSQTVADWRGDGYRPVLCLDEFENLTTRPSEFTSAVFESWRALGNAGQIAFLTASQRPLADLIASGGLTSNFDNIFVQLDLGLLDEAAARRLLTDPAARQGVAIPTAAVAALLDLCGRHPFYLQMAAFNLFDALTAGPYEWERVRADFIWDADRHWDGLWRSLTPQEQAALTPAASPPPGRLRRALQRRGLLMRLGDDYRPFSQGFAGWIEELPPAVLPTNPEPPPPEARPDEAPPAEPAANQPPSNEPNIQLLLVAAGVTLVILVVTAWVLTRLLEVQSVGSLVLLLAIAFPFVLVLVGKLAGQDFVGWLGNLLGKK